MKQALYILSGYPFAGKSTITQELIKHFKFSLVGIDEINRERGVGQTTGIAVTPQEWDETYKEAYHRINALLQMGKTVIYDATNFTHQQRNTAREIAKKNNVQSFVIFVDVTKETVQERLLENRKSNNRFDVRDEDFAQVINNFERPTAEENVITFDYTLPIDEWIDKNFNQ